MFLSVLQNGIINGGFNFWQRNTSFASVADATYLADRWKYKKSGTMVHTLSRSTDVPSVSVTPYSLLASVTTAQALLSTTGLCCIQQLIEGNFASRLYGKKLALAFYVKASKVGTYCVRVANNAKDKVLIKEFSVSVANTWERKVIRISHDFTGTWLKDTGIGIELSFVIGAGSNYNTAIEGVWGSSDLYATSNQVNGLDTIGNTFQLSEVVLVEDNNGQTTTPSFVMAGRDIGEELRLCQRYYEFLSGSIYGASNTPNYVSWFFRVTKRIAPFVTGTLYASSAVSEAGMDRVLYVSSVANYSGVTSPTADAEL